MRKNRKECEEDGAGWKAGLRGTPLRKWHVGRLAAAVERWGREDHGAKLEVSVRDMAEQLAVGAAGEDLMGVLRDIRCDVVGAARDEGVELEGSRNGCLNREGVRWARIVMAAARSVERQLERAVEGLKDDLGQWVGSMRETVAEIKRDGEEGLAGFRRDDWTALLRKKGVRWRMGRTVAARDKRGCRVGPGAKACDNVYERGEIGLMWDVNEVLLEDTDGEEVEMGDFRVVLTIRRAGEYLPVSALATPVCNNEERGGYWHPHVGSDERVCLGDVQRDVEGAVKRGMLGRVVELVEGVLRTYNEESPYKELWRWREDEDEGEEKCITCGDAINSGDEYSCDRCGDVVCSNCISSCGCGRRHLCSGCEDEEEEEKCIECGQLVCGRCKQECDSCGASVCEDCRVGGLCHECKEEAQDGAQEVGPGLSRAPAGTAVAEEHRCCVCGAASLPDDVCVDCGRRCCGADLYRVPAAAIRGGVPETVGGVRQWMCEECRDAWMCGGRTRPLGVVGPAEGEPCVVCGARRTDGCGPTRPCVDCGRGVCGNHSYPRGPGDQWVCERCRDVRDAGDARGAGGRVV